MKTILLLLGLTTATWLVGCGQSRVTTNALPGATNSSTSTNMTITKITKTDAEWQKQLTPIQFQVTRQQGTERAGTGKYADNHDDGIYKCICCGTALFDYGKRINPDWRSPRPNQ